MKFLLRLYNLYSENAIFEKQNPLYMIYYPKWNELLSNNAPDFNVSFPGFLLESMCYSIDYGRNNNAFAKNGTIDQKVWLALSAGYVLLIFHANDTLDHNSSIKVGISKGYTYRILRNR